MSDKARMRLIVLRVLMFSLFLSLVARLYYIQVVDRYHFVIKSQQDSIGVVTTAPVRGEILDAQGRPLASNRSQLVTFADAVALSKQKDGGRAVLTRLATMFHESYADLRNRVTPCGQGVTHRGCWLGVAYAPIPVNLDTKPAFAQLILEHLEDFPGLSVQPMPVRHYDAPAGVNAAQLLGYLQPVSAEELKTPAFKNYDNRQLVGRTGLETEYESVLAGTPGVHTVKLDPRNQIDGTISDTSPVSGDNIVLSLDAQVQALAEKTVADAVEADKTVPRTDKNGKTIAQNGAAIVMDAQTGRLIASVSYPSYDPSVWIGGIQEKQYLELTTNPRHPLFNEAIGGIFPPGSTFKLVTTVGAITDGLAAFDGGKYNCTNEEKLGGRVFHNFEGVGLGKITLHDVIVQSCDTTFYQWARTEYQTDDAAIKAKQKPKETQAAIAREFGFGTATGVDLPGEVSGLIEDRATRVKRYNDFLKAFNCAAAKNPKQTAEQRAIAAEQCLSGDTYNIGDQANFNIGQGTVLVTPLQLAVAYSSLVNGGKVFSPRLAWGVLGPDGKPKRTINPTVRQRLTVNPYVLDSIQSAMCQVPTLGTAKSAFAGFDMSKVTVCGKTGTAQTTATRDDTSWFASFGGPPSDPKRYVVVVVIPDGGKGADAAAPAVRKIWEGMYGLAGKSPMVLATGLPRFRSNGTLASSVPLATLLPPPTCPTGTPSPSNTPSLTPSPSVSTIACTPGPTPTVTTSASGSPGSTGSSQPTLTPTPRRQPTGTTSTAAAATVVLLAPFLRRRRARRPRSRLLMSRRRRSHSQPRRDPQ